MNKLEKRLLRGKPIELTEASPEVADLRRRLEGDCVLSDGETDVGGCIYWDDGRKVAVYVAD